MVGGGSGGGGGRNGVSGWCGGRDDQYALTCYGGGGGRSEGAAWVAFGHDAPVTVVCVREDVGLLVSASLGGLCLVHTLDHDGQSILGATVLTALRPSVPAAFPPSDSNGDSGSGRRVGQHGYGHRGGVGVGGDGDGGGGYGGSCDGGGGAPLAPLVLDTSWVTNHWGGASTWDREMADTLGFTEFSNEFNSKAAVSSGPMSHTPPIIHVNAIAVTGQGRIILHSSCSSSSPSSPTVAPTTRCCHLGLHLFRSTGGREIAVVRLLHALIPRGGIQVKESTDT